MTTLDTSSYAPGRAEPAGSGRGHTRRRLHPPVPRWWRHAATTALWSSLAVVVALWALNGNVPMLAQDPGAALISIGRLTGLLAADLLLVQVLLMARIPFVEKAFGQDRLAALHRWTGFSSINLMILHAITMIAGYALTYDDNVFHEAWEITANYPGMLMAVAAGGLLLMVAITSMRIARAKLRYESWHLLHLYAYLGTFLALPHQIWVGHEFTDSAWARGYWWTLYAATTLAVLIFRVAAPIMRNRRAAIVVDRVGPESPGVVSVHLRGNQLDRLARPGQFLTWRFLDRPGWTRGNPFSLSAAPTSTSMRITVKDSGDGSASLTRLRPGTRVFAEGPFGRIHPGVRTRRKVALIGAGIGITPLRAMLEDLDVAPGDLTVIHRASSRADLVLDDEISELVERRRGVVHNVVGPRVSSRPSWLPEQAAHLSDAGALRHLVPDIAEHDVFICGAPQWMSAIARAAADAGVPAEQIHTERFSW